MAIKAVLAAVSAATAVVGGVMAKRSFDAAADTERAVGQTNEQIADRDAEIKTREAEELMRVSALDQMDDEQEFEALQAKTRLALSQNGWLTNSGSAALIQIANADEFEQQQDRNDYASRVNRDAQREGAVQDRIRGDLEVATANSRAAGLEAQGRAALLAGASKAASVYAKKT